MHNELGQNDAAVMVMAQAYDRGGDKSLQVLKQYTAALSNNGNAERLRSLLKEYRALWLDDMSYEHGITMGFFGGQAGLDVQAINILEETIAAHPGQYDADLELAKIYAKINENENSERVYQRAYNRGGKSNINLLKAYTSHLFKSKNLAAGERLLGKYRGVWEQHISQARALSEPLTVQEQRQIISPYGHGIRSPISTVCLMRSIAP